MAWPIISKREFERGYAKRSGLTVKALRNLGLQVFRCDCHEGDCMGWQMLHKDSQLFKEVQTNDRHREG